MDLISEGVSQNDSANSGMEVEEIISSDDENQGKKPKAKFNSDKSKRRQRYTIANIACFTCRSTVRVISAVVLTWKSISFFPPELCPKTACSQTFGYRALFVLVWNFGFTILARHCILIESWFGQLFSFC
jgi:hypothetical protein